MPAPKSKHVKTILLVEDDVIIRLTLAGHLRVCGFAVLEAANTREARAILVAGPPIDILFSDAQLAGEDSGFALAQWVRRHRPGAKVLLTATTAHKVETAGSLCTHTPGHDSKAMEARIRAMMSDRSRRARPPASSAALGTKRKTS